MSQIQRIDWDSYFIEITKLVAQRSGCLKRHVGAVLVKDNRIIATGYNSAPCGINECSTRGYCLRQGSSQGQNLETCYAIHAEQNALMQCCNQGISCNNAELYCTTKPCNFCMRLLINAGIKKIIYIDDYNDPLTDELAETCDIKLIKYMEGESDVFNK